MVRRPRGTNICVGRLFHVSRVLIVFCMVRCRFLRQLCIAGQRAKETEIQREINRPMLDTMYVDLCDAFV